MLKIYYDRFTETCHNILKSLIFFLPPFLSLGLVSIFSNIQNPSFFLEIVSCTVLTPFAHCPLALRWPLLALCLSSARHPHCPRTVCTMGAPSARPPHTVFWPSARPSLVVRVPSALSARHSRVVRSSFAHRPRAVRTSSAHRLRAVCAPFTSYLRVLYAPRAVRPPYVALFHKTKLKRIPSNWYNFLSLSQELFLLLCSGFC